MNGEALLGLATTDELFDELDCRLMMDADYGNLTLKTVNRTQEARDHLALARLRLSSSQRAYRTVGSFTGAVGAVVLPEGKPE